jgi:hypothetical protein
MEPSDTTSCSVAGAPPKRCLRHRRGKEISVRRPRFTHRCISPCKSVHADGFFRLFHITGWTLRVCREFQPSRGLKPLELKEL